MSHEALPIDRVRFSEALQSLPVDALHSKVAELRNSIEHLRSSNEQMMPFADDGDQDCKDAMFENLVVIGRMNERVQLLREEVEKRGMRWSEAEVEDRDEPRRLANGTSTGTHTGPVQSQPRSGTLTDEQLRARLEQRLGPQDTGDEEDGVHL